MSTAAIRVGAARALIARDRTGVRPTVLRASREGLLTYSGAVSRFTFVACTLHRTSLAVWKHFPPQLAGLLRKLLTPRWAVGAVAVIIE
jgi:hypothetical protein